METQSNHQTKLDVMENRFGMAIWSRWGKSLQTKTSLGEFQITTPEESTNQ